MLQYKRRRTRTISSNLNVGDASEDTQSLVLAEKRGATTLQSVGGQLSGEEKSNESSDGQYDQMERNDKSNSELFGDENDHNKTSGEEKTDESDGNGISTGIESFPNHVKIIPNDKYKFKTHVNVFGSYDSKINARVGFGAQFVEFRKILIDQHIENDFKKSCFGHFLKLDKDVAVQLPMKLVHGLRLRRIFSEKKKEIWVDYNGLPICFGINEFAIMTGLRCHSPPPLSQQLAKVGKQGQILVDLVGKSADATVLIQKICDPDLTKKQKLAISMVWFLHCILCSKGADKKIETHWLKIASNKTVFDSYPWGRISFDLTISYLSKELDSTKSQYNLHGFPWTFAAWAFEAIPAIQRLANDPSTERSIPRMIKWVAATPAHKTNIDPISQTKEQMRNQIVHPFLFPTNIEKEQIFMQDIEPYEDSSDLNIDALKEELKLVTAIKMNIADGEEGVEINGGENSVVRDCGVERDYDDHIDLNTCRSVGGVERGDSYLADLGREENIFDVEKNTTEIASNVHYCCKCKACCDKYDTLLNEVKSLSAKLDGQQSKRTIYPSYARKSPYTPALKRRLAMNSKAKNARKKKLEVNLYKTLEIEKREAFSVFISKKEEGKKMCLTGRFNYEDLMNMTDPHFLFECKHVDEILALMRKRQIWFPRHYNQTDLILDLNFYNTLYDQYKNLSVRSLEDGALPMHEALRLFEMDGDILKYCAGESPYPYGRKWNGAQRIYTVMNIMDTHFIALEFLIDKGLVQAYDCNIRMCDEQTFLTLIRPILELWPKLLKKSEMFNHLDENLLNDTWSYERLQDVPSNSSCTACGPYACVFIDHLLAEKSMNCLNDNEVDNFRMKYAVAVLDKELIP